MNEKAEEEIKRICDERPDAYPDLLRMAMAFAYEDAASICSRYIGAICSDESNGGSSHDVACQSLSEQIKAAAYT